MKSLWTWGGVYFGRRDGDNLWTYTGKHVGRFYGDEVYAADGLYLGELKKEKRLITKLSKKGKSRSGFNPDGNRVGLLSYVNYIGYVMYMGFEDFPGPDSF